MAPGAGIDDLPGRPGAAGTGPARTGPLARRAAGAARLAPLPARARGRAAGAAGGPVRSEPGRLRGADHRRGFPGAVSRRGRALRRPGRRGGGAVPRDRGAPALHQPHHRQPAARRLRRRSRLPDSELEPETGNRHPGPAARRRGRPAGLRRAHPAAGGRAARRVRPGLPDRRDPADGAGGHAGRGVAVLPAQQDPHAPRPR